MKDWTEPINGSIDVPDELMPLFNKIGMQIRFHTISGKNEVVTIAHIIKAAQKFFEETKPSKEAKKLSNDLCPVVINWVALKDEMPLEKKNVLCWNGFQMRTRSWQKYTGSNKEWFKRSFTHWTDSVKPPCL